MLASSASGITLPVPSITPMSMDWSHPARRELSLPTVTLLSRPPLQHPRLHSTVNPVSYRLLSGASFLTFVLQWAACLQIHHKVPLADQGETVSVIQSYTADIKQPGGSWKVKGGVKVIHTCCHSWEQFTKITDKLPKSEQLCIFFLILLPFSHDDDLNYFVISG